MRVLIIDSDPYVLRECVKEFNKNGHEVLTAEKGLQGLEIFKAEINSLDAVVMAIRLPDIDGIHLLQTLVKTGTKILKIMFTAYDYRDDFTVWASDAYIFKNGDMGFKELLTTAERLHEGSKAGK